MADFFGASLLDKDEARAHAARLAAAAAHYKEKGRAQAFRGTSFNGKYYRGMPIGCAHQWSYDEAVFADGVTAVDVAWHETKVDTDRWLLDVTGRLVGDVTPGVYFLHGDQLATRRATQQNSYAVRLVATAVPLGPTYDKVARDAHLATLRDAAARVPYPPPVFAVATTEQH